MLSKSKFFTVIFLLIQLWSFSQSKKRVNNEIGFACGVAGMPSPSVQKFTSLMFHSNYHSTMLLLNSKIPAEKYLAVLVCEKLERLNLIKLSTEDSLKINQIYNSTDSVYVCSGCTFSAHTTLQKLLTNKEYNPIKEHADYWLNSLLKQ